MDYSLNVGIFRCWGIGIEMGGSMKGWYSRDMGTIWNAACLWQKVKTKMKESAEGGNETVFRQPGPVYKLL